MERKDVMLERSIRNSGFSALLCCTLGFILLETWMIRAGAKPIGHIITVTLGTALAALVYRAIVPYYTAAAMSVDSVIDPSNDRLSKLANVACAALLVFFGYAGAIALANGWMTPFAAFAGTACLFPWSRLGLCRTRILVPAALIIVAAAFGVLRAEQLPHPLLFPLAAWMLWFGAGGAWAMNISYRHKKSKASQQASEHRVEETANALQN